MYISQPVFQVLTRALEDINTSMAYVPIPTPTDLGVLSCVEFESRLNSLLVATHDNTALLYTCHSGAQSPLCDLAAELSTPSPIVGITLSGHTTYAGCLDGTLRQFDYENTRMTSPLAIVKDHDTPSPINHLKAVSPNLIICTSIDGTIRYFDPRINRVVDSHSCPSKLFAFDATSQFVTVGLADSQVQIFDLRRRDAPWQSRASGLRYQMTNIRSFPSGDGFALSSIDGRVSMEYNDTLEESQKRKFAFKCHRLTDTQTRTDTVYPVTGLRFHNRYHTLFTAGGDGHVCVWNWEKRKRMKQFQIVPCQRSISHMDISHNGSLMVVGTIDDGFLRLADTDAPYNPEPSQVYIKHLDEVDCKPKAK